MAAAPHSYSVACRTGETPRTATQPGSRAIVAGEKSRALPVYDEQAREQDPREPEGAPLHAYTMSTMMMTRRRMMMMAVVSMRPPSNFSSPADRCSRSA